LTGACVVALGEFVAGLFTKNDKLASQLYNSGMKTYDRVWRLPMWDDYNELNKSDVADVKNVDSFLLTELMQMMAQPPAQGQLPPSGEIVQ